MSPIPCKAPVRLLLINPALPESFWSFRWWVDMVPGKRAINLPLGLATLAALCRTFRTPPASFRGVFRRTYPSLS